MPPIDPMQLLRALSPLLSAEGGIRSVEEVGRLSSLMKKFSKKLVSRCVYVNVLRASKTEDLDGFLQKGGWETIHSWLQDTKTQQNNSFLLELLKLYRVLPMTVERLKENNSAKLLKSLTKSDREDIKQISTEIVNSWVKLVSGKSGAGKDDKSTKKKKRKDEKEIKSEKDKPKEKDKKDTKKDEIKKEVKNSTTSKENKAVVKTEDLEDVQLPDYIRNPEPKDIVKVKERKSTVKLYQTKFRSTGMEEPAQLPRPSAKKNVEKVPPLIISKNSVKRIGSTINKDLGPIPKKSKPPNLTLPKLEPPDITMKEQTEKLPAANERREIKLIAPRPKPIHTLTESAGFMDALVAPVNAPIRKKRKSSGKAPTTPPSPTPTPTPKLQFYKDTLEVPEENGSNGNNKKDAILKTPELQDGESKEVEPMEEEAVGDETPLSPKENDNENDDTSDTNSTVASNKRKRKTKRVSWAEESNLRQIFFFELDETERVNVNNVKNFGDLKTLERLKEREAVESARRMMGTGEERMSWFLYPIDNISSLIIVGSNSKEKEIQKSREESVLQEIFFSKESLPETPHEPDPEFCEPEEPKIIPLEDENNPDAIMDYSMLEPPAPVTTLPPALSNLFSSMGKPANPMEVGDYNMYMNMTNNDPSQQMPPNFLPPGPPNMMGPNPGLLGGGPPMFNNMGGFPPRPPMGGPYPDGMDYYGNQGPDMPGPSGGGHPMGRPPRGQGGHRGGPNRGWGPPRGQLNNRNRGGGRGGRGRIPCHHFMAGGCKYEESCKFLHPGVNGPPL